MVYTDYFLRGKQPIEVCPLHDGQGFFDRVAGLFGKDGEEPVPAEAAGLPPSEAARPTTGVVTGGTLPDAERADAPEEPRKKRGFWSRVFGRGKDKDKETDKEREPERRP
jgi:hypothetical protein